MNEYYIKGVSITSLIKVAKELIKMGLSVEQIELATKLPSATIRELTKGFAN